MDDRSPDTSRSTVAEREPILVHHNEDGWQVDYGSYAQGYHGSQAEALEAAILAGRREQRRVVVERTGFAVNDRRESLADERDTIADLRDAIADERDTIADEEDIDGRLTRLETENAQLREALASRDRAQTGQRRTC